MGGEKTDSNNLPLRYGCPHYIRGKYCNPFTIRSGRFLKDFPNWIKNHCKRYGCEACKVKA